MALAGVAGMRDLRHALRQLARSPGFTAVALLTLAIGIGACAAIFSVVNGVLLRPLPYPQSERIVAVYETDLPEFPRFTVAPGQYFDWREQARSFESLGAVLESSYNLTGLGQPVRILAAQVTANMFSLLRTRPLLGRDFAPDEDQPGKPKVAILAHGFWIRQLGGRPDVVGRAIQLDGQPYTVIGVM